jgi:hypothetical protein
MKKTNGVEVQINLLMYEKKRGELCNTCNVTMSGKHHVCSYENRFRGIDEADRRSNARHVCVTKIESILVDTNDRGLVLFIN